MTGHTSVDSRDVQWKNQRINLFLFGDSGFTEDYIITRHQMYVQRKECCIYKKLCPTNHDLPSEMNGAVLASLFTMTKPLIIMTYHSY